MTRTPTPSPDGQEPHPDKINPDDPTLGSDPDPEPGVD